MCEETATSSVNTETIKGDMRKGVQEHPPHTPLLSGSVPKSPGWRKLFNCSNKKQTINQVDQRVCSPKRGILPRNVLSITKF